MSMAGYTKLFNSILASTIWRETDTTRIVWITLLAMADKDGIAEGSVPGLADLARVSIEDCETALEALTSPDHYSRTSEHEGRRVEIVDGVGWRLLNHAKYRMKMSEDERREYNRKKQAEWRSNQRETTKKKVSKPVKKSQTMSMTVNDSQSLSAMSAHTDTDTDTDTEAKTDLKQNHMSANADVVAVFEYWQTVLNHPTAKLTPERKRSIESRLKDGSSPAQITQAIDGCCNSPHHMGENDRNAVYDDLTLICRSGSKLEQFIGYGATNGSKPFKSIPEPRNEIEFQKMLLNQEPK